MEAYWVHPDGSGTYAGRTSLEPAKFADRPIVRVPRRLPRPSVLETPPNDRPMPFSTHAFDIGEVKIAPGKYVRGILLRTGDDPRVLPGWDPT